MISSWSLSRLGRMIALIGPLMLLAPGAAHSQVFVVDNEEFAGPNASLAQPFNTPLDPVIAVDDTPGEMNALTEIEVSQNATIPTPPRWGDYFDIALDPDGMTFWIVGQIMVTVTGPVNHIIGSYAAHIGLQDD